MDNPPDFSPIEPLNNETTPSGPEWGAMALGFVVGIVWFVSYQAIMIFIINYLGSNSVGDSLFGKPWFNWSWRVFGWISSFAYGLVVGFIVSYRARHQHDRSALIVILALFAVTFLYSVFSYWKLFGFTEYFSVTNVLLMVISLILNLAGALNGVYFAQSFKRNRGVRI